MSACLQNPNPESPSLGLGPCCHTLLHPQWTPLHRLGHARPLTSAQLVLPVLAAEAAAGNVWSYGLATLPVPSAYSQALLLTAAMAEAHIKHQPSDSLRPLPTSHTAAERAALPGNQPQDPRASPRAGRTP